MQLLGFVSTNTEHLLLGIQIGNLKHSLAKVVTSQHTQESLNSVIDTLGNTLLGLEATVRNPFLELLLVFLGVLWTHVRIADDESLHLYALAYKSHDISDGV
jgi:hypothetical protein